MQSIITTRKTKIKRTKFYQCDKKLSGSTVITITDVSFYHIYVKGKWIENLSIY